MEFNGVVEAILPERQINKKDGSVIIKYSFVVKENQGQYPKQVVMNVLGEDKWKAMNIAVGGTYNVQFDVSSREYKGNWYTECNCWRTSLISGQTTQSQSQAQQNPNPQPQPQPQQQTTQSNDGSDLPF